MSGRIARKRNSLLPCLLVLAVGGVMWVLLCTAKMSDSLSTACLTIGLMATALGLILTAMNLTGAMTHYVYLPTQSRMREKKIYISGDDYNATAAAIASGNVQAFAAMHPVVSSNSAVRILVSADGVCALVQAVRDESGHFEPGTEVLVLAATDVSLIQSLTK